MSAPSRTLLSDLPKGHAFPVTTFVLTAEYVAQYLAATGDANAVYTESGLAPPLAVAARALGALLDVLDLPPGTLHTGQEVESRDGVRTGATLQLSGRIAQRSERAGLVISILEFEVTPAGTSAPALAGRTTVMAPR